MPGAVAVPPWKAGASGYPGRTCRSSAGSHSLPTTRREAMPSRRLEATTERPTPHPRIRPCPGRRRWSAPAGAGSGACGPCSCLLPRPSGAPRRCSSSSPAGGRPAAAHLALGRAAPAAGRSIRRSSSPATPTPSPGAGMRAEMSEVTGTVTLGGLEKPPARCWPARRAGGRAGPRPRERHRDQGVVAAYVGVGEAGSSLLLQAIGLTDRRVHVDGERVALRQGAGSPGSGQGHPGDPVQAANVSEGKRAQEDP